MVKSCKIELWTCVAPIVAPIVSPDRVISKSLIAALIYDTVVAKNFFEPPSVRVATSELFVLSVLPSSSVVVPLQHVCSAFLDIPEVTPPTKLRPSVNYKLYCHIHESNPVQFRFVQSPWIALTTSQVWLPPLVYSWIYEAKPEVFPKLPQITLLCTWWKPRPDLISPTPSF